jgi:hypothetical protein
VCSIISSPDGPHQFKTCLIAAAKREKNNKCDKPLAIKVDGISSLETT